MYNSQAVIVTRRLKRAWSSLDGLHPPSQEGAPRKAGRHLLPFCCLRRAWASSLPYCKICSVALPLFADMPFLCCRGVCTIFSRIINGQESSWAVEEIKTCFFELTFFVPSVESRLNCVNFLVGFEFLWKQKVPEYGYTFK